MHYLKRVLNRIRKFFWLTDQEEYKEWLLWHNEQVDILTEFNNSQTKEHFREKK